MKHWFEQGHKAWETGNTRDAFRAFLRGAKAGDVSCQQNVGYFYDEGLAIRKNRRKAIRWYKKSAAGGSSSAAYNLGAIFERKRDYRAAVLWFERALQLGESDAETELLRLSGSTQSSDRR